MTCEHLMKSISFCAALIPSVMDGSKTMTRRIVKGGIKDALALMNHHNRGAELIFDNSPFKVGDILYVKEPYYQFGHWEPVLGAKTKGGKQKWKFVPDSNDVRFVEPTEFVAKAMNKKLPALPQWHKRLARFMPQSARRTKLQLVSVRVERLSDISEADAVAEGINGVRDDWMGQCGDFDETLTSVQLFKILWESINGEGSWSTNPLVWVLTFKKL